MSDQRNSLTAKEFQEETRHLATLFSGGRALTKAQDERFKEIEMVAKRLTDTKRKYR